MTRSYEKHVKVFEQSALAQFAFLVDEYAFNGPIASGDTIDWSSPDLRVQIFYDTIDGRVTTSIGSSQGRPSRRADLSCLFVKARLGVAQEIRETAHSGKQLEPVVLTHARALRELLPVLLSGSGASLLDECMN